MNAEQNNITGKSSGTGLVAVAEAMRVSHWIKNAFVAAPLLFAGQFGNGEAWLQCLAAVGAFCLLSSAVYLINDICDRNRDAAHPDKCNRPIPSGRLSVFGAGVAAFFLLAAGSGIVAAVGFMDYDSASPLHGLGLPVWTAVYLVLNILYSFWLKSKAIIDVIIVALGFVLRAMAGAAAISVPISPWLVVCTFTLCLFIALTKRRSEILSLPAEQVVAARDANRGYDRGTLEHMLTVSTAVAIMAYCLYCLAPRTVGRLGSAHMVWTIPLVIYGMFRFYRMTQWNPRRDPVSLLVRDRIMWIVLAAYVVVSGVIVKYGSHESVRSVLDFEILIK